MRHEQLEATCLDCDERGERAEYKGNPALACPGCGKLLVRE